MQNRKMWKMTGGERVLDRKKELESFQETKKHGSTMFPFNIYPCTIPGDFPSVALHWHKSMEIIFVKKGTGRIQTGRNMQEARSGDIFVMPPGTLHAIYAAAGYNMEYENIIFEVEFLGGGAADVCDKEYLVPLASGQLLQPAVFSPVDAGYKQISACLRRAEELCSARERGYELGVKAALLELLLYLLRMCPEAPERDTPDMERLKRVLQRIEQDYAKPLTVPDMAAVCGCSSSHFMRWFKRMTGTSPLAYLNERRLAAAAENLRETDDKILVIAENAGFENLSNFNRQFKKRYGVTPRAYRG